MVVLHAANAGRMQLPTPIMEQSFVGSLVGNAMSEAVLELGNKATLVRKSAAGSLVRQTPHRVLCFEDDHDPKQEWAS